MTLPNQYLLSDLLKHRVRCDQGLDHGPGLTAWMHPPVHRLLGWCTRPSTLNLSRHVWKLDQLRGIGDDEAYVKGQPSNTDQLTLDRLPTLLNADVLNINGEKIAIIADLVFEPISGKILHYLVSRTDPRIPGTSRWRLLIERILDQQPGMVSVDLLLLDDLPLSRSSIRQNLLRRSRHWRDQIQEFSDHAGTKLEGWLDEAPWEDTNSSSQSRIRSITNDPLEDWDDELTNEESNDDLASSDRFVSHQKSSNDFQEDPWV